MDLNVNIIKARKNLGWGNAANLGIFNVKTKYALLLNPDIKFLTEEPILNFEKNFSKYENIGMASCITLNQQFEKENGRITFFSTLDKNIINNISEIPEGDTSSTINCVYGGAIIFFDVDKFKSIKGFDTIVSVFRRRRSLLQNEKKIYEYFIPFIHDSFR